MDFLGTCHLRFIVVEREGLRDQKANQEIQITNHWISYRDGRLRCDRNCLLGNLARRHLPAG